MENKFSRVLLHFGGDKTGSTAIQTALNLARNNLLGNRRIAYAPGVWHSQFASFFCDAPETFVSNVQYWGQADRKFIREADQKYINELNRWLNSCPPCETLMFSFEGFASLDTKALERMREFCMRYAPTTTVLLYARPPLSYALSAMSQRVKQGRLSWEENDLPLTPYKDHLEKIISVFGRDNVLVRKFVREKLLNGDVIDDLLGIAGAMPEEVAMVKSNNIKANESLSRTGLLLGEEIIKALSEKGSGISQGQFLERFGQYLGEIPGGKIRLTTAQCNELLRASKAHTLFLKEEFSIDLDEDAATYVGLQEEPAGDGSHLLSSIGSFVAAITSGAAHRPKPYVAPEFALLGVEIKGGRSVAKGAPISCELEFSVNRPTAALDVGIHLYDEAGRKAFGTNASKTGRSLKNTKPGTFIANCLLVADLPDGSYTIAASLNEATPKGNKRIAWLDHLLTFKVKANRPIQSDGYGYLASDIEIRNAGGPHCAIQSTAGDILLHSPPTHLPTGSTIDLPAKIRNLSEETWRGTLEHPVRISYHWLDENENIVVFDGLRTALPGGRLRAGESRDVTIRVIAPEKCGKYYLCLLPLQEKMFWFDSKGFTPLVVPMQVDPVAGGA